MSEGALTLAGRRLPDIALAATTGGLIAPARQPGLLVLFVYPYTGVPGVPDPPGWDDIPGAHGSTPEALGFRDRIADFHRHGAAVMGLSGNAPEWQAAFATRVGLPYPLLSDAEFAFAGALDLPRFQAGALEFLARLTLIAVDGAIVHCFHPVPMPATHADDVMDWLETEAIRPVRA
ncbi:MAG: peroxiredoxin [Hyphomicrobiaceae bacterium]|nr:peroxiredoxin [Hyphomicrobiaceae bacterium]